MSVLIFLRPHSATTAALLLARAVPDSSFVLARGSGIPRTLSGRLFAPRKPLELTGLDLAYVVAGDTIAAVPVDEMVGQSLEVVFHEMFHVFQANAFVTSSAVSEIFDDPVVLTDSFRKLAETERMILATALAAPRLPEMKHRARQYLAVRRARIATVTAHVRALERQLERLEGTAHLVGYQLAFATTRGRVSAATDSVLHDLRRSLDTYPAGLNAQWPLMRWRLYGTGAAMGLLLDRLQTDWRGDVQRGAVLDELLAIAIAFNDSSAAQLAIQAIAEFHPPLLRH
ncbi:MAG: hypothetical protein H7Z40_07385 [Phycisphaerae bacterium]|nr:hypothetical protein [Gemmatimonadaceae bacterium]